MHWLEMPRGSNGLIVRNNRRQKPSAIHGARRSVSLCAFTTLVVLTFAPAAWPAPPVVSAAAPDFALKSLAGDNLRLSEYRSDIVMVNFWSTRCGRCRDQLSKLDALYGERRAQGFQLLSVNIDRNEDTVRDAVESLQIQFPVLLDTQSTVAKLYDLRKMPFTVLIDPTGIVRYVHSGYRRGDEHKYASEMEILSAEFQPQPTLVTDTGDGNE